MSEIVAIVVGIDVYDYPGWKIDGPYRNALEVACILIGMGANPKNIDLIVTQGKPSDAGAEDPDLTALKNQGVKTYEPTRANILDRFARAPEGRSPGSRLFVYWCGHGYANQEGHRVLICQDFGTGAFNDRIFNATLRFRWLGSNENFSCFSEEIFLADVCAKHTPDIEVDAVRVKNKMAARQVAAFATREGGVSKGGFSEIVIEWLRSLKDWPELDKILGRLVPEFKNKNVKPFVLDAFDASIEIENQPFGDLGKGGFPKRVLEVYELISATKLDNECIRKSFDATVGHLRLPRIGDRLNVFQMVRTLAEMADAPFPDDISEALLQFVMRLGLEADGGSIMQWIDDLPKGFTQRRESIGKALKAETEEQILIVEIEGSVDGKLAMLDAFACFRNGRWVNVKPPMRKIGSWEEVCGAVNEVLDLLIAADIHVHEIQFVVEPLFFHLEFHRIKRGNEGELGELFTVVLREMTRAYRRPTSADWKKYKEALGRCTPDQIKILEVPADATKLSALFASGEGLCCAGFVCGPSSETNDMHRDALRRLILRGVAYAYWLQQEPAEGGEWIGPLRKYLTDGLSSIGQLKEFPEEVRRCRTLNNQYATNGALLWDDPDFKPFSKYKSPARG